MEAMRAMLSTIKLPRLSLRTTFEPLHDRPHCPRLEALSQLVIMIGVIVLGQKYTRATYAQRQEDDAADRSAVRHNAAFEVERLR